MKSHNAFTIALIFIVISNQFMDRGIEGVILSSVFGAIAFIYSAIAIQLVMKEKK